MEQRSLQQLVDPMKQYSILIDAFSCPNCGHLLPLLGKMHRFTLAKTRLACPHCKRPIQAHYLYRAHWTSLSIFRAVTLLVFLSVITIQLHEGSFSTITFIWSFISAVCVAVVTSVLCGIILTPIYALRYKTTQAVKAKATTIPPGDQQLIVFLNALNASLDAKNKAHEGGTLRLPINH